MCSDNKVDDDWVIDDNIMSHSKKKRHSEKEEKRLRQTQIKGILVILIMTLSY